MYTFKKICLSCKYYRLTDEVSGVCRVDKKNVTPSPWKANEDTCARWHDCGQQYFIRIGWINAQKTKDKTTTIN